MRPKFRENQSAGGEDDGVGDEIAGEHPGGFVGGGGEAAGDVGERDGGDGGVEHFHEGREHDGGGDEPGVDALGDLGRVVGCCGGGPGLEWLLPEGVVLGIMKWVVRRDDSSNRGETSCSLASGWWGRR